MSEIQKEAKKALSSLYLEVHESIAADVSNKVNAAIEEIRMETIYEVQDFLLKQMNPMIYDNGYPIKAVSQATILTLPYLLKSKKQGPNGKESYTGIQTTHNLEDGV